MVDEKHQSHARSLDNPNVSLWQPWIQQHESCPTGGWSTGPVALRCGAKEWIDTRLTFDLKRQGNRTVVLFAQRGWRKPVEFMHYCSTKWAAYLLSLKSLVEKGKGSPCPDDMDID